MANYTTSSPWKDTKIKNGQYLDQLTIRPVPAENDDILYEIQPQYTYRPDLLAHDLYGDYRFWWVFAQRNMNVLKDPVYDFVPGTKIFLPKERNISSTLGA